MFNVLYSIEETIKAYRNLCRNNISSIIPGITLDQALILIIIDENEQNLRSHKNINQS